MEDKVVENGIQLRSWEDKVLSAVGIKVHWKRIGAANADKITPPITRTSILAAPLADVLDSLVVTGDLSADVVDTWKHTNHETASGDDQPGGTDELSDHSNSDGSADRETAAAPDPTIADPVEEQIQQPDPEANVAGDDQDDEDIDPVHLEYLVFWERITPFLNPRAEHVDDQPFVILGQPRDTGVRRGQPARLITYRTATGRDRNILSTTVANRERHNKRAGGYYLLDEDTEIEGIEILKRFPNAPRARLCRICDQPLLVKRESLDGVLRDAQEAILLGDYTDELTRTTDLSKVKFEDLDADGDLHGPCESWQSVRREYMELLGTELSRRRMMVRGGKLTPEHWQQAHAAAYPTFEVRFQGVLDAMHRAGIDIAAFERMLASERGVAPSTAEVEAI